MFNLEFVTAYAVSATSSIFRLVDSVYHARPAMPPLTALCIFMFIPLDVTYDIRYSFPSYLTNIKRVGVDNRYRTGWGVTIATSPPPVLCLLDMNGNYT